MAELAKAYVQIIPSAKGISGELQNALSGETSSAGQAAGENFGNKMVSAIKKLVVAAGIGKLLGQTISEGSQLEQSIGGVKTLFGTNELSIKEYAASVGQSVAEVQSKYSALQASENTVFANAKNAWKTAGLSANDYMQQATSFAAALVSSLGGDTQAAAEAADTAIIDMADNANKMGTDMQSIQNAYQGFAKQNYTMLDNLKLGYGGTKTEMERLLADAQEISGVEYDISNLSDVYSAIHVIQEQMGITGTTTKEAASTWTGSFAAMRASAQNVMGNLFTGADITEPLSALVESTTTFLSGNLIPAFGNIAQALPQAFGTLGSTLFNTLTAALPQVTQAAVAVMQTLTQGIAANLPQLLASGLQALMEFSGSLRTNAGLLIDAGLQLITALVQGLIAALPVMIETIPTIVTNIAGIINDNAPKLLTTGLSLLGQLALGIIQAIPVLIANLPQIIEAIVSVFTAFNWLDLGSKIITLFSQGITAMIGLVQSAGQSILTSVQNAIMNLPSVLSGIASNAGAAFTGALSGFAGAAASIASSILSGIAGALAALPSRLLTIARTATTSMKNAFTSINWGSIGSNIINGIISGITGAIGGLVSAAANAAKSALNAAKSALGIHSPSKEFAWIGEMSVAGWDKGFVDSFETVANDVADGARSLLTDVQTALSDNPFNADVASISTANRAYAATAAPTSVYSFGDIVFQSPEAISESSATREMQDFMKRMKWDLP